MDAVQIPSETVPTEMRACEQILKRAKELKKPEPVVAYWCKSVRSCFSLSDLTPQAASLPRNGHSRCRIEVQRARNG